MSEPTPGLVASAFRVTADAVVTRDGVPIDDDGNPIPASTDAEE